MSGVNNGPEQQQPQTKGVTQVSDGVLALSRYCAGVVEKYQLGHFSFSEAMVQIALKFSQTQATSQEAEVIARQFCNQLEWVQLALV